MLIVILDSSIHTCKSSKHPPNARHRCLYRCANTTNPQVYVGLMSKSSSNVRSIKGTYLPVRSLNNTLPNKCNIYILIYLYNTLKLSCQFIYT